MAALVQESEVKQPELERIVQRKHLMDDIIVPTVMTMGNIESSLSFLLNVQTSSFNTKQMSVPSFTSFPQFEAEPSRPQSPSDESQRKSDKRKHEKSGSSSKRRDHERRRDSSKERRREKDRHKKRDKDKHRDKDGKRREDERRSRADDIVDESYRLFFSDRRPDHLNVQYGGLHAGDIPKYRMKAG